MKSNFTSWCIQNLSKRALNWLTSGSLEYNSLVNIVNIDNMVEEAKKRHVEEEGDSTENYWFKVVGHGSKKKVIKIGKQSYSA